MQTFIPMMSFSEGEMFHSSKFDFRFGVCKIKSLVKLISKFDKIVVEISGHVIFYIIVSALSFLRDYRILFNLMNANV